MSVGMLRKPLENMNRIRNKENALSTKKEEIHPAHLPQHIVLLGFYFVSHFTYFLVKLKSLAPLIQNPLPYRFKYLVCKK